MVSSGVLKAKLKRNGFVDYAGRYYVSEDSEIVKKLNKAGEHALIGIQKRNGTYTIIGEYFIHYRTSDGKEGRIGLSDFIKELINNVDRVGWGFVASYFKYRSIVLNNGDKVWLRNSNTMSALWNTILWLEKRIS